ncbi:YfbU family protein [Acinetobacter oleivorans]|uniref:YfbU family protein n=1 Tax=Acinetobacter TaxID=469 RepID=UPI0007613235|nr:MULTISPECIES: YfbU family protein [Acinetobacter]WQF72408.1 YfbU family protein [Acinetobacter oleivorans]
MQLELTDKERLILANQYEILGLLKKEDYYLNLAEQLRDGHKWLYRQSFNSLYENLPDEDAELVINILQVYEALKDSYNALSDKSGITIQDVSFAGFDGNNEPELIGFVDALNKAHRFSSTIDAGVLDSHMPQAQTYQNMIQKWHELDKSNRLTKEQILYILSQ